MAGAGTGLLPGSLNLKAATFRKEVKPTPICLATWNFHETKTVGELLYNGTPALNAVERGVRIEKASLINTTVGNSCAPDRHRNVTLDACIISPSGYCGSVVYLKEIEHPVSVARKLMEETPHMAGEGAFQFAIHQGFQRKNLLTKASEKAWKEWLKSREYKPIINIENHDTIGILCLDEKVDIAKPCTTSGLSYKMKDRKGDSPIIGAGLYLDNQIGGAVATGMGEAIMKSVGSFLFVEQMRQGKSPQEVCEIAVERIVKQNANHKDFQVAFLALTKNGEKGSFCLHQGFSYLKYQDNKNMNNPSQSYL